MSSSIVLAEENFEKNVASTSLTIEEVVRQVKKVDELKKNLMRDGEHFGTLPGCQKPCLLKSGAEKICFVFRLTPSYKVEKMELLDGHREYVVTCSLARENGAHAGAGLGSCSTMETQYRYRKNKNYEKIENPNIFDTFNTCLKMAKKRAFVDAVLTTTASSDIFTQDIEDIIENGGIISKPADQKRRPILDQIHEIIKKSNFSQDQISDIRQRVQSAQSTDELEYIKKSLENLGIQERKSSKRIVDKLDKLEESIKNEVN
jgi:hypothetical protein